ncbi:MAG: imidazolonepropionase [Pseudomonadota bacterium]|jgi:imidazolonepropionase
MWDQLLIDVQAATAVPTADGFGLIPEAAIAIAGDRIAWVGSVKDLPAEPSTLAKAIHRGGGRLVTPGLIDCHTHLIFGGERSLEFDLRAQGVDYATIAAQGGGIRSTVRLTRELSAQALAEIALPRARALLADGVTTIEVKSGYGLDTASELKMLEAARLVGLALDVSIEPTLLALHALPRERADDRSGYVDEVIQELLPAVAERQLARAVDVFCEHIAFTVPECARVLQAARQLGLHVKVHADQLTDGGGAALAAQFGALSADHLEFTSTAGVQALAASGTVAVLLPGAFLMLGETRRPPIAALRAAGVPMAIATDLNPGSSPLNSLTLAITLARAQFGLTASEGFLGVTAHAARALGLSDRGQLGAGLRADLALWNVNHPRELGYWLGKPNCHSVWRGGRAIA